MKKVLASLLALAMIVTGFLYLNPNASEVNAAAASDENSYVTVEKANWENSDEDEVPDKAGYLFAGYYNSDVCTSATRATKDDATHAKFVKADTLDVKVQITNGVVQESDVEDENGESKYVGKYVIRFVSSVESLDYSKIGFELEYEVDGQKKIVRNTSKKVFERIDSTTGVAKGKIDSYDFSPKMVGEDSEYFMTAKLPVTVGNEDTIYKVRAFWETYDGQTVFGKQRCVSINDSQSNIVNMSVQADKALTVGGEYTATYGSNAEGTGASNATVEVLTSDANGYSNVRITLVGEDTATGLKSATKFVISDAEGVVATPVYRNYYTDVAGTADTSWWEVDQTATRFTIASVSDLYGLASVVNGGKDHFQGDEIHLVRNVEVNKGVAVPASQTDDGVAKWVADASNKVAWTPIGQGTYFRGVFDGDNNTISGLYIGGGTSLVGLFGGTGVQKTDTAEILNVRLTNSYFETSYKFAGSIVSHAYGMKRVENVYSDAVIVANTPEYVGGLVGRLQLADRTIKDGDNKAAIEEPHLTYKNCWFDGEINSASTGTVHIGGITSALNNTYRVGMVDCLYTGTINCANTSAYVGGLFSRNVNPTWLEVTNCLSTGEFNTTTTNMGGLFAMAQHPTLGWVEMSNCYTSAEKAWNTNAYDGYTKTDYVKTAAELAAANVNTLFPGHNGAWVNNVNDAQTPILSSFASWWNEKQNETGIDTSWYDGSGDYTITTAAQLNGFAELSKTKTFAGEKVKLGANIVLNKADSATVKKWVKGTAIPDNQWTPIGPSTSKFAGEFDGQGYTISGLYLNTTTAGAGLFGYTEVTSQFKNFKLVDSYMKTNAISLGIVGYGSLTSMENIYTNAIMESSTDYVGGFVGIIVGTNTTTFKNCWFDGKITQTSGGTVSGFVGYVNAKNGFEFYNCLSTGYVSGGSKVGGFLGHKNYYSVIKMYNCLSVGELLSKGTVGSYFGHHQASLWNVDLYNCYGLSDYKINGDTASASPTKFDGSTYVKTRDYLVQTAEATLFPALTDIGETDNAWVSDNENGWNDTDRGTPILASLADWWRENVEHDELTIDLSWYNNGEYVLYDAGDLAGLAYIVNNTNDQFAGKTVELGANIQLNKVNAEILASWQAGNAEGATDWTPIGTSAKPFAGIFDGKGYTISGLYLNKTAWGYYGLFGCTTGATVIKNFQLADSYMSTTDGYLGVVGYGTVEKMENIYSNAIMNNGKGFATGGMLGDILRADAAVPVEFNNCWFDGSITSGGDIAAGILGNVRNKYAAMLEFNNCLNSGDISCRLRAGGILGYMNNGFNGSKDKWVFNNCLSVGNVQSTGTDATWSVAGVLAGAINTNVTSMTANNSYGIGENVVGKISSGTIPTGCLKARQELINSDVSILFPESDAWVNDIGWNDTDRGTPILASFADWWMKRNPAEGLKARPDTTWYDGSKDYTLTTASQLYGFAELAKTHTFAGEKVKLGANIVLNKVDATILAKWVSGEAEADNMWTPIGTEDSAFAGEFDGQGYTISGLYLNATTSGAGLFGYTAAASQFKNFKLVDSYMQSSATSLGIVGYGYLTSMENIYTNAIMKSSTNYVGGFVGTIKGKTTTTFKNCWYDGTITQTGGSTASGFIGYVDDNTIFDFYNCLSSGSVSGGSKVGGFLGHKNYYSVIKMYNCLSVGELSSEGSVGSYFGHHQASLWNVDLYNCYGLSDYKINGDTADGSPKKFDGSTYVKTRDYLVQTEETTLFPALTDIGETDNAWQNDIGWNDTDRGTPILASFAEWWLARQPETELAERADTSWYSDNGTEFTLKTASQLYGFAALGQTKTFEGKIIKLENDIALNQANADIVASWKNGAKPKGEWTPLVGFAGEFDGQGYTISGLYLNATTASAGLFGTTTASAVIKNFKLVDSYMKSTANGLGIVGTGTFASMENIYTDAVMESTANNVAGFAGTVAANGGTVLIENCWFDGEIIHTGTSSAGGFIAADTNATNIKFSNCLSTGKITGTSKVGGFMGVSSFYAAKTFNNCLSAGNYVATGSPTYCGTYFGQLETSPYNYVTTNTYGIGSRFIGVYPSSYVSFEATYETATYLKNRDEICGADVATLFAGSEAWVNDNEDGWNDTDRGTPILAEFETFWRARQPEATYTVDMSWYSETGDDFTLYDLADVRGFVAIANNKDNFVDKKVKLGADIVLNEVDASILTSWKGETIPSFVWTPIGTAAKPFAGEFDGQGYTISGLYLNTTAKGSGMFGTVATTAQLKNFQLVDSYMKSTANNLGLVGEGWVTSIENVYNNTYMTTSGSAVAGFVPYYDNAGYDTAENGDKANWENATMTIKNCWFDGEIVTSNQIASGFVGRAASRVKVVLENCLYTGTIVSTLTENYSRAAAFHGWADKSAKYEITNCLMAGTVTAIHPDYRGEFIGQLGASASGVTITNSYAYGTKIMGNNSNWESCLKIRQELIDADVTVLFPTSNKWQNDIGWNDTDRGTPILKDFAEWWLGCNPADDLKARPDISWYDESGSYTIKNADQLYGLAQLSKTKTFEGETIKLETDIVLNDVDETILAKWVNGDAEGRHWTPIGTASSPFQGVFDGQGNTISGLFHASTGTKVGLFGSVELGSAELGSKIGNFKLIDSYISGNGAVGIVGYGIADRIENIYTNVIIESTGHNAGGIIGQSYGHYAKKDDGVDDNWAQSNMSISKCWFDGQITMKDDAYSAGGVIGGTTPSQRAHITFDDCLYTGHIAGERADEFLRLGGFIGWQDTSAQYDFTNCLSVGSFEATNTTRVGGFVGNVTGSGVTFTNCYTTYGSAENVGVGFAGVTSAYTNTSLQGRGDLYLADVNELFTSGEWVRDDAGWNDTDRGTPILKDFAGWWLEGRDDSNLEGVEPSVAWYSEEKKDDTGAYVIDGKADLLGFMSLSKQGVTFESDTIKLAKNITLNSNWEAGAEAPAYTWTPIGTASQPFAGTFDGNGKSISGVYVKSSDTAVGFFGKTAGGSEIKNFRLLNSYIEQSYSSDKWSHFTGAVVGDYAGNMDNVYSDATVVSSCHYDGGLIGRMRAAENTEGTSKISNCWFDGNLQLPADVRYVGGIVGLQDSTQGGGILNFENVLFTGHIKANVASATSAYIGGIIGTNSENKAGTETHFESVVSAGTYDIADTQLNLASVAGYLQNGTADNVAKYSMNNVFATRGYNKTINKGDVATTITGEVIQTAQDDRLIGYNAQSITDTRNSKLITEQKLDFTTNKTWTMRKNGVPIPTALCDVVSQTTLFTEDLTGALALSTIGKTFSDAVPEGAGDYVVTATGDYSKYETYLQTLYNKGFTPFVDNAGTTMFDDEIYSATYVKGGDADSTTAQWAITVTYVAKKSEIFVVINGDAESVASTLKNDATNEIGQADGSNPISLSMVEDKEGVQVTGNCFVYQLPNKHFIINDGNTNNGSGAILKAYLQKLAGKGEKIYIDAWTLTHFHNDHGGALMDMLTDSSLRANVYVDAFYVNEASMYAQTTITGGDALHESTKLILEGARRLQRPDTNTSPLVYQVHMGQRYYFNGITMDIVNTPDQLADDTWSGGTEADKTYVPDSANTSSINFLFTVHDNDNNDDNDKKVLLGGDTTAVNMRYIMAAYGEDNSTLANINVFAAYHHGKNAMTTYYDGSHDSSGGHYVSTSDNSWADYLLNNTTNFQFDAVLFPNYQIYEAVLNPDVTCDYWTCNGKYTGVGDNAIAYPKDIGERNEYYCAYAALNFTTGFGDSVEGATADNSHGTVKLTFNTDGISWIAYSSLHGLLPENYVFNEF